MLDKEKENKLRKGFYTALEENKAFLSEIDCTILKAALDSVLEKPHPNGLFTIKDIRRDLYNDQSLKDDFIWNTLKKANYLDLVMSIAEDLGEYSVFGILTPQKLIDKGA